MAVAVVKLYCCLSKYRRYSRHGGMKVVYTKGSSLRREDRFHSVWVGVTKRVNKKTGRFRSERRERESPREKPWTACLQQTREHSTTRRFGRESRTSQDVSRATARKLSLFAHGSTTTEPSILLRWQSRFEELVKHSLIIFVEGRSYRRKRERKREKEKTPHGVIGGSSV